MTGAIERGEKTAIVGVPTVMVGYLQHGAGTAGPFRTESVRVKHEHSDRYLAWFEGRWRRVHIAVRRKFIVYRGERITIQIYEGV